MLVFVFLIVLSLVFYLYYKTKQFRTALPIRRKWYASTASMGLGSFVAFFGINQLFLFNGAITYVVAAVFVILGGAMIIHNFKAAKHYHSFVEEEAELNS